MKNNPALRKVHSGCYGFVNSPWCLCVTFHYRLVFKRTVAEFSLSGTEEEVCGLKQSTTLLLPPCCWRVVDKERKGKGKVRKCSTCEAILQSHAERTVCVLWHESQHKEGSPSKREVGQVSPQQCGGDWLFFFQLLCSTGLVEQAEGDRLFPML